MRIILVCLWVALCACQTGLDGGTPRSESSKASKEVASLGDLSASASDATTVHRVLDDWHKAASEVQAKPYLDRLADDAVFMGTDPEERWDKAGFSAYVNHYFLEEKRGWKYVPSRRHVMFSPDRQVAWFDERLENTGYGVLRGTGVLRLEEGGWRITHYSMTFAIPNDFSGRVAELVRKGDGSSMEPGSNETTTGGDDLESTSGSQ